MGNVQADRRRGPVHRSGTRVRPGAFFKDADATIVEDLRSRGLLLRDETIEHPYPLCWRCDTPLMYVARTSWYIRTTAVKDRLLEVNEQVDWYPTHQARPVRRLAREQRRLGAVARALLGNAAPDLAVSNYHDTAIGSLAELSERAGRDVTGSTLTARRSTRSRSTARDAATRRRVPEVIDTWYDSGAMPYAQWGYRELGRGTEIFDQRFPADFIAEGSTRRAGGSTLMAEAVLLFDDTAYRTVVCLGLLVDAQGRKMSKSLGNTVDAFEVMDRQGADALRWYLLTGGGRRGAALGIEVFDEVVGASCSHWNVYSFFVMYANASGFDPSGADVPVRAAGAGPVDPVPARRVIEGDGRLGVRRDEGGPADRTVPRRPVELVRASGAPALLERGQGRPATTRGRPSSHHDCLVTLSQLLAPSRRSSPRSCGATSPPAGTEAPESVHLSDFPGPERISGTGLDGAMRDVRSIVELGRRARTETKVRVRQPLAEAVVHDPATTPRSDRCSGSSPRRT